MAPVDLALHKISYLSLFPSCISSSPKLVIRLVVVIRVGGHEDVLAAMGNNKEP